MADGPDLPTLTLRRGAWSATLWDPRPAPLALGARYVHGGYVAELCHGERVLTARAQEEWSPYAGQGLPEVFEMPLGFSAAQDGEEYLRVGAGRMRRRGREWPQADRLSVGVAWELLDQSATQCVWRCADAVQLGGKDYGYQLTRVVALDRDGLRSQTTLALRCPWSEPLIWFAHPFFNASRGDATALILPTGARVARDLAPDDQGRFRLPAAGGFTPITGVHGAPCALLLELDPNQGGGQLAIAGDFALDKLVVFGTQRAFSVEPYLSHGMQDGEVLCWSLQYGFQGPLATDP